MNVDQNASIQVIGAGLPRTGTSSLQAALHTLGYKPCYHMASDLIPNMSTQGPKWAAIWDTKDKATRQALLREVLRNHRATVDFPGCAFVDDFIETYPNAKVVLGLRKTPEQWRKSFNETLQTAMEPWWVYATLMFKLNSFYAWNIGPKWEAQNRARFDAQAYHTDSTDLYVRHNDWVRSIVPRERLLELEPGEGWEPLCKFLGKEVPNEPYPRVNDTKSLQRTFRILAIVGATIWVAGAAGLWFGGRFLLAMIQKSSHSEL